MLSNTQTLRLLTRFRCSLLKVEVLQLVHSAPLAQLVWMRAALPDTSASKIGGHASINSEHFTRGQRLATSKHTLYVQQKDYTLEDFSGKCERQGWTQNHREFFFFFLLKPNKVCFAFCPCSGLWFFTKHFSWDLSETDTGLGSLDYQWATNGKCQSKKMCPYMTLILALQKKKKNFSAATRGWQWWKVMASTNFESYWRKASHADLSLCAVLHVCIL